VFFVASQFEYAVSKFVAGDLLVINANFDFWPPKETGSSVHLNNVNLIAFFN